MIDLTRRSDELEIIDFPERMSEREMRATLRELRLVNRWLGGTAACLKPLKPLLKRLSRANSGKLIRIVDFGCGGADIPMAIVDWARAESIPIQVVGVDFSETACRIAREAAAEYPEIQLLRADVFHLCFKPQSCHFAICSAFLHHFKNRDIASLLSSFANASRHAIVINDLQRSRWAYWGIRLLTTLLSRSAGVKNDGPLSVRKGFQRRDFAEILLASGLQDSSIAWRWAFRYSVLITLGPGRSS